MAQNNLPLHWSWVKLGDVVERMSNGCSATQIKDEGEYPITRIETISFGEVDLNRVRFVNNISKEDIEKYQLHRNDILFSHINSDSHLGKTALFRLKDNIVIHGINLLLIRSNERIRSNFLNYLFNYYRVKGEFLKIAQHAVNQSSINQKKLKAVEIPLPPLPEQKKIVEKIEELFSGLDSGVASLKKAKEQIKLYRQSVLAAAFSGLLLGIDDIFQKQDSNVKDVIFSGKAAEPNIKYTNNELPAGWKWVKLGEVIHSIRYGTSKKCYPDKVGIPVLRIPNIINGFIDDDDLKYSEFDKDEIIEFALDENDILIIRSNGSLSIVGRSAIVSKKHKGFLFAGYLMRIRVNPVMYNAKFLNILLSSYDLRNQIEFKAKSTSGVNNINAKEIQALNIPLPPLNQQHQIVSEIEKRFSEADNLEKVIDDSLKKSGALRQSILKKAFEGRLV